MSKFVKSGLFVSKMKKMEGEEMVKTEHVNLEFFMASDNPAFMYARHFVIFKNGCPED